MDLSIIKDDVNVKPSWRLLSTNENPKLSTLFNIYSTDKAKAKIYFHLNKGSFTTTRKVLFEYLNGDFKFVVIRKIYGISSTNKMYSSEKTLESLIYKNKKFYYYNNNFNKFIKQLSYNDVNTFTNQFGHSKDVHDYLVQRFGWVRFISEDYSFNWVSFNTIINNKLYNKKSLLRHIYGCPYPVAKFVHDYTINCRGYLKYLPVWKEMRKNLINIENLSIDMFNDSLFQDTCRFAQMLGLKVNCSWGLKRLKVEHDKWSKVVIGVLLESEELIDLDVHPMYMEFAEHSGFELLRTNHDLIAEGNRMNHCVGTYSSSVNNGVSGIYRVSGHTLELNRVKNGVRINQFMGRSNVNASIELYEYVKTFIDSFEPSDYSLNYIKNWAENNEVDLPF
jgi:hypothetical protein